MTTALLDKCIICGSSNFSHLKDETKWACIPSPSEIWRCTRCGLGKTHPQQKIEYEEHYYRQDTRYAGDYERHLQEVFERRMDEVDSIFGSTTKGPLLDVGCAEGFFLNIARKRGWPCQGLELSEWSAGEARKKGFEVIREDFLTADLPENHYAVVHMSHVLEHFENPIAAVEKCRKILRKDGLLMVEVPIEFQDLRTAVFKLVGRPVEKLPMSAFHLFFFNASNMKRFLRNAGFRIVKLTTPRYYTTGKNILNTVALRSISTIESVLRKGPYLEVIATPSDR